MDVLLDGGFKVDIITKNLKKRLRLLQPKHAHYILDLFYHTMTKLVGLIKNLKIFIHSIHMSFTILQNNLFDSSYSMLLNRPWLQDAKVSHD
jgi:hypothetical protein